jgi:hypothetical protein
LADRSKWFTFRHPKTGQEVQVHPLDVGKAFIYHRHGWGLMLKSANIFDASVS